MSKINESAFWMISSVTIIWLDIMCILYIYFYTLSYILGLPIFTPICHYMCDLFLHVQLENLIAKLSVEIKQWCLDSFKSTPKKNIGTWFMDSTGLPQSISQPLISTTYNSHIFFPSLGGDLCSGNQCIDLQKESWATKKNATFIILVGLPGSLYSNGLWNI